MASPNDSHQKAHQLQEQPTQDAPNQLKDDSNADQGNKAEEVFALFPNKRVPFRQISKPHSRIIDAKKPDNAGGSFIPENSQEEINLPKENDPTIQNIDNRSTSKGSDILDSSILFSSTNINQDLNPSPEISVNSNFYSDDQKQIDFNNIQTENILKNEPPTNTEYSANNKLSGIFESDQKDSNNHLLTYNTNDNNDNDNSFLEADSTNYINAHEAGRVEEELTEVFSATNINPDQINLESYSRSDKPLFEKNKNQSKLKSSMKNGRKNQNGKNSKNSKNSNDSNQDQLSKKPNKSFPNSQNEIKEKGKNTIKLKEKNTNKAQNPSEHLIFPKDIIYEKNLSQKQLKAIKKHQKITEIIEELENKYFKGKNYSKDFKKMLNTDSNNPDITFEDDNVDYGKSFDKIDQDQWKNYVTYDGEIEGNLDWNDYQKFDIFMGECNKKKIKEFVCALLEELSEEEQKIIACIVFVLCHINEGGRRGISLLCDLILCLSIKACRVLKCIVVLIHRLIKCGLNGLKMVLYCICDLLSIHKEDPEEETCHCYCPRKRKVIHPFVYNLVAASVLKTTEKEDRIKNIKAFFQTENECWCDCEEYYKCAAVQTFQNSKIATDQQSTNLTFATEYIDRYLKDGPDIQFQKKRLRKNRDIEPISDIIDSEIPKEELEKLALAEYKELFSAINNEDVNVDAYYINNYEIIKDHDVEEEIINEVKAITNEEEIKDKPETQNELIENKQSEKNENKQSENKNKNKNKNNNSNHTRISKSTSARTLSWSYFSLVLLPLAALSFY
ncbi:uncharacterized protein ASCRUDRAFT_10031 [Ascoidea rubescens DSM 1968]|uniref:Uncharacterized protein n=1 Tax=Ascoidea rubescens DSM 1968 TaxID=1344418 RepID=A0A1D2VAK9_9ASCO|nr:hypothetical protein ASCRUDRAFT_10031 [Ascoidea rubescens DSM 1968]ODV58694.1 hypothetical protein ASCRUDRAFT_10031 [Ascoidea rubescens DSM 1968]